MPHVRALLTCILTTAIVGVLPSQAAASVEIGSRCVAGTGGVGTRVQTVDAPGGPSYTVASDGVVVKWGMTLPTVPDFPARLKIVRPGVAPGTWSVVGQSDSATFKTGETIVDSRVAVKSGDRIALYSLLAAPACTVGIDPAEQSAIETSGPDTAIGGTVAPGANANARLSLFAIIEADADGDGYGDETQDLCPQSAGFQIACPALKLSKAVILGDRSLAVLTTINVDNPVTLSGSAKVPAYGGKRGFKVKFKAISKTVKPGSITRFNLKNPRKLKSALRRLPRSAKIKVTLKLSTVGLINTDTHTIRATFRGIR